MRRHRKMPPQPPRRLGANPLTELRNLISLSRQLPNAQREHRLTFAVQILTCLLLTAAHVYEDLQIAAKIA